MLQPLHGNTPKSKSVHRDTVLMAINEINAKGGVLGKKLEPVLVDTASEWQLFEGKGRQQISKDKVAVVFGCWIRKEEQTTKSKDDPDQEP